MTKAEGKVMSESSSGKLSAADQQKVEEIAEQILKLPLEVSIKVAEYIEEKTGVSAAMCAPSDSGGSQQAQESAAAPKKLTVTAVKDKMGAIKAYHKCVNAGDIAGKSTMGLMDAKKDLEALPLELEFDEPAKLEKVKEALASVCELK